MLKKDLSIALSYKFSFFSQFLFTIFQIIFIYYISLFVGNLEIYDNISLTYFHYVIFGMCFTDILITITTHCPREILNYKYSGIFEEIVSLKQNFYEVIFSIGLYSIFISLIKLIIYIVVSSILIVDFIIVIFYFIEIFLTIILLILSFLLISILASSYTIVFLKVGFIPTLFLLFSVIFGNAYFPNEILPEFLSSLSKLTTFTYGIENIRMIQMEQIDYKKFYENIFWMTILNTIYFFLGYFFINKSIKFAKKNGTLLQY